MPTPWDTYTNDSSFFVNVCEVCQRCFLCVSLQMSERLLDTENEAMAKIVELEKQLMQTNKDLDSIRVS